MINDTYFQLKPSKDSIEIIHLSDRLLKSSTKTNFSHEEKKVIKIGRDKDCDVKLNWDKTFSKIQCQVIWDGIETCWKLIDGNGKTPSRNGTWVFASKSIEIVDNLNFKVGNTRLVAKIYQQ